LEGEGEEAEDDAAAEGAAGVADVAARVDWALVVEAG